MSAEQLAPSFGATARRNQWPWPCSGIQLSDIPHPIITTLQKELVAAMLHMGQINSVKLPALFVHYLQGTGKVRL
jgi:hypothetical protein